ncbi:VOC family protein [Sporosarcina sp. Te-1]|uniref:VOC family protein n=1 Tax=Sporosarcina sp. Te-1 TaxID=2818390 RepID=UPI001A9FE49D|nr:VOC family protein [Sporosarcina sp. Te-1]QTD42546.1 VOC family protein [Sporosarcina sp. Te-1]
MSNFVSHIATVEIPVTNLQRSIEFYVETLGVSVTFQGEKQAMLSFGSKGVPTMFLVQIDVHMEEQKHLSFVNPSNGVEHTVIDFYTDKLSEFHSWLADRNVEVSALNINEENGLGGFGFKDPDGNLLSACNILHEHQ